MKSDRPLTRLYFSIIDVKEESTCQTNLAWQQISPDISAWGESSEIFLNLSWPQIKQTTAISIYSIEGIEGLESQFLISISFQCFRYKVKTEHRDILIRRTIYRSGVFPFIYYFFLRVFGIALFLRHAWWAAWLRSCVSNICVIPQYNKLTVNFVITMEKRHLFHTVYYIGLFYAHVRYRRWDGNKVIAIREAINRI